MTRPAIPAAATLLAVALIGLLVYGVVQRREDTSLDAAISAGLLPPAPGADVRLPSLSGERPTALADLRGQVVVLNFWASWCDPCIAEAPALERAQQRLQREGGTVLGVTYKDFADESRRFVRRYGITYPTVRDDRLELAPKFGTNKLPETFVLDTRGRIVAASRGQVDSAFLTRAIDRALEPR